MYLEKVKYAFLNLLSSEWGTVLYYLSCFGNALANGDKDSTVSGRVGFNNSRYPSTYWKVLMWCIDQSFYPIQGSGHCYSQYTLELSIGVNHTKRGNLFLGILALLVILSCLIIAPFVFIFKQFKLTKKT